jgi:PhnB protein
MQLNPYLTFNGDCEAAFRFYEKCLGGKIAMMLSHGDSPMADQVQILMGSDAPPDRSAPPKGFHVSVIVDRFGVPWMVNGGQKI